MLGEIVILKSMNIEGLYMCVGANNHTNESDVPKTKCWTRIKNHALQGKQREMG